MIKRMELTKNELYQVSKPLIQKEESNMAKEKLQFLTDNTKHWFIKTET